MYLWDALMPEPQEKPAFLLDMSWAALYSAELQLVLRACCSYAALCTMALSKHKGSLHVCQLFLSTCSVPLQATLRA